MGPSAGNGGRPRRRKISLACEPCRERKSRCDGAKPICSTCRRRGLRMDRCLYKIEPNARHASNNEYIDALHTRIRVLEEDLLKARMGSQGPPAGDGDPPPVPLRPLGQDNLSAGNENAHKSAAPGSYPAPSATITATADLHGHQSIRPSPPSPQHEISVEDQLYGEQFDESDNLDSKVTAMGTVSSNDGLDDDLAGGDQFYGKSSAASFIREACGRMSCLVQDTSDGASPAGRPFRPRVVGVSSYFHAEPFRAIRFALPPRSLADHLVGLYFEHVFYQYPIFHRPSFEKAYRALWEPDMARWGPKPEPDIPRVGLGVSPEAGADSAVFHAALNAIFALGCHFSHIISQDRDSAGLSFHRRAKALLDLDFIETNTIGVVQTLLILTLFLQSTPFAGPCWNSIGVACRLAHGMGLHMERATSSRTRVEKEIRRRLWHGCVVLDMTVSMTFGRPTMTTHDSSMPLPSLEEDVEADEEQMPPAQVSSPSKMTYFAQSVRLSRVLEGILSQVYQPWRTRSSNDCDRHSFDAVIELDSQLADFEATVPYPLNWTAIPLPEQSSTANMDPLIAIQKNILRSRFLYIRLILYRPILSDLWSSRQVPATGAADVAVTRSEAISAGPTLSINQALRSSFAIECGTSCVRCAIELLDLIYRTFESEETATWWWCALYASTSGLVLVYALSCPPVRSNFDDDSLMRSWEACSTILYKLSTKSLTVQKSFNILEVIYSRICGSTDAKKCSPAHTAVPNFNEVSMTEELFASFYPDPDPGMFDLSAALRLDAMEATMHGWDVGFGPVDNGDEWPSAFVGPPM